MTDIEGFLTIYGHSDNLLNNNYVYSSALFNLASSDLLENKSLD